MAHIQPRRIVCARPSHAIPELFISIQIFKDSRFKSTGLLFSEFPIDDIINQKIISFNMNLSSEYNYQILYNIFRDIQYKIKEKFILNMCISDVEITKLFKNEKIMNVILNNAEQLSKRFIFDATSIKSLNNNTTDISIDKIVKSYLVQTTTATATNTNI